MILGVLDALLIAAVLLVWNLIFPLGALAFLAAILFSERRGRLKESFAGMRERLGLGAPARPARGAGFVWIHAASLGELAAAAPLLKSLRTLRPRTPVLLTSTSPSGRRKALELAAAGAEPLGARFAPLDFLPAVWAFLSRTRPRALILLETEIWPNLIALSAMRGIPIAIASARLSPGGFRRYRMIKPLLAPFLRRVSLVLAQNRVDAGRFAALGVPRGRIVETGNLKYDSLFKPDNGPAREALRRLAWEDSPIFVAASTHGGQGEEEAVLRAYSKARAEFPALRLVLAPRHAERAGETARLLESAGLDYARASRLPSSPIPHPPSVLLIDTFGLVASFYEGAQAAFVGGTLAAVGGHNLLEPASAGIPVLFGPNLSHVEAEAAALEKSGGGLKIADAESAARALKILLASPGERRIRSRAAKAAAAGFAGAAQRTIEALKPLLDAGK